MSIKYSIIIINKDDIRLKGTLSRVIALNLDNTEIIVVDYSKIPLTSKSDFPNIKWLDYKPTKKKHIYIPEQRNAGLNAAKGEIIIFLDSGCYPEPGWFEHLIKPILDRQTYIVAGSVKPSKYPLNVLKYDDSGIYLKTAPTINLALSKDVMKLIGYFDENFDYGSDTDFTYRAVKNGLDIMYVKNASVTHGWGDNKTQLRRSFNYGTARAMLLLKHKFNRKLLNLYDLTSVIYIVYLTGLPISVIFPWYLLLPLAIVVKNAKRSPLILLCTHFCYAVGIINGFIRYIKKDGE